MHLSRSDPVHFRYLFRPFDHQLFLHPLLFFFSPFYYFFLLHLLRISMCEILPNVPLHVHLHLTPE